jgi:hypothetical protein
MANRHQLNAKAIEDSKKLAKKEAGTVMWAAYCIDCDKIIGFDKSKEFIDYLVDRHFKMPQTTECKVMVGKIYDVEGPLTEQRLKEMAKHLDG